jgi:hypothetical protein
MGYFLRPRKPKNSKRIATGASRRCRHALPLILILILISFPRPMKTAGPDSLSSAGCALLLGNHRPYRGGSFRRRKRGQ